MSKLLEQYQKRLKEYPQKESSMSSEKSHHQKWSQLIWHQKFLLRLSLTDQDSATQEKFITRDHLSFMGTELPDDPFLVFMGSQVNKNWWASISKACDKNLISFYW